MIDINYAKENLSYNSDSGYFVWRKSTGRAKAGDISGNLKPEGYISIRVNGKGIYAHRLAWIFTYGEIPRGMTIDHINHNKDDNRICNLRCVSQQHNTKNASLSKANTSGTTGVYWDKQLSKWYVVIGNNYKYKRIGTYDTKEKAILIRKEEERKLSFHENHGKMCIT